VSLSSSHAPCPFSTSVHLSNSLHFFVYHQSIAWNRLLSSTSS
jgi:hypothetical protein